MRCNPVWGVPGKMWAYDHAGITPDIVLTAKGIGSGMPISAFIAKESVMQWKPGSHGTTYGGQSGVHRLGHGPRSI